GKQLFEMRSGGYALSVAFAPDGKTLAAGLVNGQVLLLEPDTGKLIRQWMAHRSLINRLTFSPDGKELATLARDRVLAIWDPSNGAVVRTIQNVQTITMALSLAYSADGKMVASADHSPQGKVRVWDPATGKELHT